MQAMSEETECAICFEDLDVVGGAVPLPCDCRVAYCLRCWDRALAASMSACGRAVCPSCRGPMHVDFDPVLERLRFSRAAGLSPKGDQGPCNLGWPDTPSDNWRRRLYMQAKPLQIRLLQRYGEECMLGAQAATAPAEGGQVAAASAEQRVQHAKAASGVAGEASAAGALPRCVCGYRLAKTHIRDRVLAFVSEGAPVLPLPKQLKALIDNPPVICDICCWPVRTSHVWTCENGRRTVLHAAAYDVCEECFALYAHGEDGSDIAGSWSESSEDDLFSPDDDVD